METRRLTTPMLIDDDDDDMGLPLEGPAPGARKDPAGPESANIFPRWLVERKDFQTFFPRFSNKVIVEDDKLRLAAQKDPDARNGIDIQLLSKWLVNVPALKSLNVPQAGELAKRMRWASFEPLEFVFHKGDIGDACYILVTGEVFVVVNNERVGTLKKGMSFGEVALELEDARRTADIQASERGAELLVIRGEDYQKNVFRYQAKRRKKLTRWLRNDIAIFRDFSDNKLRYFESVSIDLFLHAGNCVYMEGEDVGALYFIKSGSISLEKNVLFETKHRRPVTVHSWVVQSHKTSVQVPCFNVEATGCFGMEFFVQLPTRSHTAVVLTDTHLVAINKVDCASTMHTFSVKAVDRLCEKYRDIWNATVTSTQKQVRAYNRHQRHSTALVPQVGANSPIFVRQRHPDSKEEHPNYQFPSLERSAWTATNAVVAKAQRGCDPATTNFLLSSSTSSPTLGSKASMMSSLSASVSSSTGSMKSLPRLPPQ
ncbi:hypothetical protein SDRG_12421 [Saprolegnia diclina VS20]|uniref:Cyclic nucleotide-binding domain-containing protein n=1 Tax=Saprolegnia diclina (strain VS20) TaxID=1156394 RepID=T0RJ10_SAPDV|nr:hypothetical protein SDRG_12421 [Saprolegnia diclina VS20]EQC29877.1 hypothetical protein SDRG_12421 [Saprolegnia diclina VS20]|eukprot:XP_008616716.1 hypothetical protein SDRG_12421 [Saprolegnia diclina VS20]